LAAITHAPAHRTEYTRERRQRTLTCTHSGGSANHKDLAARPADNQGMTVVALNEVASREIFPGFQARVVHSARVSESWVEAEAGASFPEHRHPHEQIVNVLQGELELTVGGVTHRLTAGQVLVIAPEVPHSGRAISQCRVLDVFAPTREEYR